MVETPGVCQRGPACEVSARGQIVAVPLGAAFLCPGCGGMLTPPVQHTPAPAPSGSKALPVALACAAVLMTGAAVLAGRMLATRAPDAPTLAQVTPPALAPKQPAAAPPVQAVPAPKPVPTPLVALAAPPPAPPDLAPAAKPDRTIAVASPAGMLATLPPMQPAQAPPRPMQATSAPVQAAPPLALAVTPPAAALPSTPPPALADAPFSPTPVAGGAPAYPASLAEDGRPGRVIVTCQIQADGRPQACHASAVKGGPAFAASVLAWLDRGFVRFHPVTQHGRTVAAVRSWPLSLEEPPAMLAEARREAQAEQAEAADQSPAPAPMPNAVPPRAVAAQTAHSSPIQPVSARVPLSPATSLPENRPFSTRVLQGGTPDYPSAYGDTRRGNVTVRCTIQTDGSPKDCDVVHQEGGSSFGQSVQTWLRYAHVRFAPIIADGHPVTRVQTWTVSFQPPPQQ